jgi:hypothetical protein
MMRYIILADYSLFALADRVTECIELGWKPTGGVAVSQDRPQPPLYLQAMTKSEP